MPKIDLASVPIKTGSSYPGDLARQMDGRSQQKLGAAAGLTQFGANLVTLAPGAKSSLRHWHEQQDEFVIVTDGQLTLVDNDGHRPLATGDCAAFPAGEPNGHHLINNSDAPAQFLVIGTHTETETAWYADIDIKVVVTTQGSRFTTRGGAPL